MGTQAIKKYLKCITEIKQSHKDIPSNYWSPEGIPIDD